MRLSIQHCDRRRRRNSNARGRAKYGLRRIRIVAHRQLSSTRRRVPRRPSRQLERAAFHTRVVPGPRYSSAASPPGQSTNTRRLRRGAPSQTYRVSLGRERLLGSTAATARTHIMPGTFAGGRRVPPGLEGPSRRPSRSARAAPVDRSRGTDVPCTRLVSVIPRTPRSRSRRKGSTGVTCFPTFRYPSICRPFRPSDGDTGAAPPDAGESRVDIRSRNCSSRPLKTRDRSSAFAG